MSGLFQTYLTHALCAHNQNSYPGRISILPQNTLQRSASRNLSYIYHFLAGCQTIRKTTRFGRRGQFAPMVCTERRAWVASWHGFGWLDGFGFGGLEQVGGARSFWYAAPSSSSSVLPELEWERGERREGRPPGRVAVVSSAALTPRASAESSVLDAANRRLPFPKSADTSVTI